MRLKRLFAVLVLVSCFQRSFASVTFSASDYQELKAISEQLIILTEKQQTRIEELQTLNKEKQASLTRQNEIIERQERALKRQKTYSTGITILAIAATSILIYKEVKD